MSIKINYKNNNEIGNFITLDNNYCLVPDEIPSKVYKKLRFELEENVELVLSTIGNSCYIGSQIIGNSKGILLPSQTTLNEFINLKRKLPDNLVIKKCPESIFALGNCVATNDFISIVGSSLDNKFHDLISDTLGTELFCLDLQKYNLLGSMLVLNNILGIVSPLITVENQDELSSILQIPLVSSTINRGNPFVGSGILINDKKIFYGQNTSKAESILIDTLFNKLK
mmetsp:Transcript_19578/g.30668  ORF Transcript_19578/g.30668 Transcript_19578/m.30668 type:complete len:227 (-) Transcript_19578:1602-2282(-)